MTSPACSPWGVVARTVDDHELRPRNAGRQLLLAAHGDPTSTSSRIPDETSRTSRERPRRSAIQWSTIGTTTASSDVPGQKRQALSRGERHADADSNCIAKCSANRLTASHSV